MTLSASPIVLRLALAAAVALVLALAAVGIARADGHQSSDDLQHEADDARSNAAQARQQQEALAGDVAAQSRLIDGVEGEKHGGGIATPYAHNSSNFVSVGQSVAQGQTIAAVGCTGHCFGDDVHFEYRVGGSAVDPMGYL